MPARDLRAELLARPDLPGHPRNWTPEPGDVLVGTVVRFTTGRGREGKMERISVVREESTGEERSVWLTPVVLIALFEDFGVQPGDRVGIRRLADNPSPHYKRFDLLVERPGATAEPALAAK